MYVYVYMYVCMYVCKYVCKYVCIPPNSFRLEISPIRSYYARVYLCKYVWMYSIYVSVRMYIWCANLPFNVFESRRASVPGSNLFSCVYVNIYVCMQVYSYVLKYVLTSYTYLTQHYIHTNISKHNVYVFIS